MSGTDAPKGRALNRLGALSTCGMLSPNHGIDSLCRTCTTPLPHKSSAALDGILSSIGDIVIPCPSTGATLNIALSVPSISTASGFISGSTVTFCAADLESTPTELDVVLDVCGEVPGGSVVVSADYTDDQGNTPDLSLLTSLVVGSDVCDAGTPAPTVRPTKKHRRYPKRGKHLRKGRAKNSKYLGCYVHNSHNGSLDGPVSRSSHMTAQVRKKVSFGRVLDQQAVSTRFLFSVYVP